MADVFSENFQPANPAAIQQVQPGIWWLPDLGKAVRLTDVRQDDFYDTVAYQAAALSAAANALLKPFNNVSGKPLQHTNMERNAQINGRNKFAMLRLGAMVRQAPGAVNNSTGTQLVPGGDVVALYDNVALTFKIGNSRLVSSGPLIKYQSGYGATGAISPQTSVNSGNTAVNTNAASSLITLGVPSQAAAPRFFASQPINDQDTLNCDIRAETGSWLAVSPFSTNLGVLPTLSVACEVTIFLFGIVELPLGS